MPDHDPANPDNEQLLFESLSMDKASFELLQVVRFHLNRILEQEKRPLSQPEQRLFDLVKNLGNDEEHR